MQSFDSKKEHCSKKELWVFQPATKHQKIHANTVFTRSSWGRDNVMQPITKNILMQLWLDAVFFSVQISMHH